ncbi:CRISPR-associated protein Cas6 [Betaproteobacteria bacterium]|nr:CRISPR-associated protein Cas6 [Betaproteobacteria bacterium]GHU00492.1 CRISPR-associated protein Cas6 [Betaproteobacteria bacterium]GHU20603.1 CRISPR-associated protein Cas6 [Betaproteobacteria bacterium]
MTLPLLMTPTLPLARCRFRFIVTTPIRLPEWSGSLLRGAFGHGLRQLSCMTRQKDCGACPLQRTCPYPAIFAPPAIEHEIQRFSQPPAPYLIEPEQWGARHLQTGGCLQFNMVLMGRALYEFPLIVEAWRRAAGRGLGPAQGGQAGTAELNHIDYLPPQGEPVALYRRENNVLAEIPLHVPVCPPVSKLNSVRLRFISPLRLQDNGHALSATRLTPASLLTAAIRRVALSSQLHGGHAPEWDFKAMAQQAAGIGEGEKALQWRDWGRRSSRQQRVMKLGGVMGDWQLTGELTAFFPALYMGTWLHVGKETVFGLGRYELDYDASQ